ncbi:hypothetical protein ACBI99_44910 [Nonomuraea sp. ATR24]|uniref:hypothetical protein n=1 Tax=Nonomuraea sp. ATR24 TaxID=1676744 RepID=UPI0035C1244F
MARELPEPSPEGKLIRRVRESIRPRLSVPAAAARAGISDVTWGNIERGYKSGGRGKPPIPVKGSAQLIAHMAYELGLGPADLAGVGRPDAAGVLREMQGPDLEVETIEHDRTRVFIPVDADTPEEDRELIRRWGREWAESLRRARQQGPDQQSS